MLFPSVSIEFVFTAIRDSIHAKLIPNHDLKAVSNILDKSFNSKQIMIQLMSVILSFM